MIDSSMHTVLLRVALAALLAPAVASSQVATYTVGSTSTSFPHHWEECVGSGHATLTLRADWRAHLTRARRDLGVKRTRFHGLFDDDFSMSLGAGSGDGDPADDFKHDNSDSYVNLDKLIDFYDSLGMDSPLFELSFMPSWLSTNTSRTVTHYRGITSPPKNYSKWGKLIEKMATHLNNRYPGKKMMFEVWNEPNGGFWTPGPPGDETNSGIQQQTYFELYKQTADALARVSTADFQVGGPATAGCPGWTSDLIKFTRNTSTKLDFISCHNYGGGGNGSMVGQLPATVSSLRPTKQLAGKLPVVVTEWSSSWMYTIDYHDEPGSAPFIVAAVAGMDGLVDISSYWVFSDVFEEGGILPGPYHGGFGLMTVHGTPKPAYRAFELLHGAGMERLAVDGICPCYQNRNAERGSPAQELRVPTGVCCDCAPLAKQNVGQDSDSLSVDAEMATRCTDTLNNTAGGLLATRNATTLRLFLYNHPTMSSTTGMACNMTVQVPTGVSSTALANAALARIDETHTNPKAKFKELGEPQYPTSTEIDALEKASEVIWGKLSDEQLDTTSSTGALENHPRSMAGTQFSLRVPANGLAVVDVELA